MNNDLNISMKLISSDNITMKVEDSKPIDVNMNGGIVEIDPIFTDSPAYTITYNDITYWNNKSNFSGNYNDLTNKPRIPTQISQLTNDVGYITKKVNNLENYTLTTNLASVALSGEYSDLLNTPTIPTKTSDLTNDSDFITNTVDDLTNYTLSSSLATVATSGSYADLTDAPTLATVATTGFYSDLINKPTIPTATSQLTNDSGFITSSDIPTIPTKTSDLQNDSGFITNTVNDLTNYTLSSSLATVATSGSYADLSNKPTIPTNTSDLNNDSGYITNTVNDLTNYTLTSSLATVATSGSYADLSNKPTIPTKTSELTNDSNFATTSYVDDKVKDVFSKTETEIGTFDGAKLYRKILEYTSTMSGTTNIAHGVSNINLITRYSGYIIAANSKKPLPVIYPAALGTYGVSLYDYDATNLHMALGTWAVSNCTKIVIVIEYTKS